MTSLLPRRYIVLSLSCFLLIGTILPASAFVQFAHAATSPNLVPLDGSIPAEVTNAHLLGSYQASVGKQFTVELLLAMNHQDQVNALMSALYNPQSPQYHHWLATGEFDTLFGPTPSQVSAVKNFLTGTGLTLVPNHTSAFLLEAQGSLSQIEKAFAVSIKDYRMSDGQVFFSNDTNPLIPASLKGIVSGVLGLNNVPMPHSQLPHTSTANYGGGPNGSGLTPSQLAGIYNADPVYEKLNDAGQGVTLGLFELYDYTHSDIDVYEQQFDLPHVPIAIVPVAGGTTNHSGAIEVELDIEAQIALAPKAKRILAYEAPPTLPNFAIETLQIASDNEADVVSVSYGVCERLMPATIILGESLAYTQMALQGQSAFAASGDTGAFSCLRFDPADFSRQVSDPASQPFVTAVGGTSFAGTFDPGTNPHPTYPSLPAEHAWSATGGGVSRIWARSPYQAGPGVDEPGFSQSGSYCGQITGVPCRELPDVSLDADPRSGFAQYCTDSAICASLSKSGWLAQGGTSLSSPLWSAIAALADSFHGERLGLVNFYVYKLNSPNGYSETFHDITVGDNGFYPAGPNYDMSTGIGSANIYGLVKQLKESF